jgi:hypothetical protein
MTGEPLAEENQLDLFGDPPATDHTPGTSSADSLPSPWQASDDFRPTRYLWPPGFWWVGNPDDPPVGCQVESRSPEAALKKACRTHLNGYPRENLEVRPLRVAYGGYSDFHSSDGDADNGVAGPT